MTDSVSPIVDSVAVITENVFSPEEVENTGIFRLANSLRFKTRPSVVEREVLLRKGQPYDSALTEETERNLRRLALFREVEVDTLRVDGRLVAQVHSRDAWSTQPILQLGFASDGTVTGRIGLTEANLMGTGNLAHIAYRKDVDRDGLELATELRRLAGTQINLGGTYFDLSDGNTGTWFFGDPWRSFVDTHSVVYGGDAASRQEIQYRVESSTVRDTTRYWRKSQGHRLFGGVAANASPAYYTRFGLVADVRNLTYVPVQDTAMAVPDTIRGFIGLWGEYRRSEFLVTRFMSGFGEEDINLSATVALGLNVAPQVFGYESFSLGPTMFMQAGGRIGEGFVHGSLRANGLFNAAGLDSGRVVLAVTVGRKPGRLHSTVLHARAGLMENPPPGGEFDLGFAYPPRSWEPHSFVGTRTLWGTLEHRWFAFPRLFNLFGLGLAGFLDYGGAWYADQAPRWGGAAGFGLRTGSSRASGSETGRIDIGYRFGSDVSGSRWVLSFGVGWVFP
jgi:hypothetical protein